MGRVIGRAKRAIVPALVLVAGAAVAAERVVIEAILARVNDRVVTITEFRDRLRQELSQQPSRPEGDELRSFAEGLFDSVVEEMLLLERAEEMRIKVEDSDVDRAIDALREENKLEDEAAFGQALEDAGLSVEQLRRRYRENMLLHRAVQSEIKTTDITEEELRQIYEEEIDAYRTPPMVVLEQLVFPVEEDGSDREEVVRVARGLVARVSEGTDLVAEATLAGVEVQELGSIPEADLRPVLRGALAGLEDGGMTEPMEIPGGIQVLRLVERVPEGHEPFESVKESLRRRESRRAFESQTQGLVERLKEDYLVEIHRDLLDEALGGLLDV